MYLAAVVLGYCMSLCGLFQPHTLPALPCVKTSLKFDKVGEVVGPWTSFKCQQDVPVSAGRWGQYLHH